MKCPVIKIASEPLFHAGSQWSRGRRGASSCSPRCRASTAQRTQPAIRRQNGAILGLMKSAAMEFGQHSITVNAIIPGLVDTPLTRYEKRLSETIGETGRLPIDNPTPNRPWK